MRPPTPKTFANKVGAVIAYLVAAVISTCLIVVLVASTVAVVRAIL